MSTLLRDELTRKEKEIEALRAENERLRFQVAELDFGAGGVLASLQSRKEESEALRQRLADAIAEQNRLIDAREALRRERDELRQEYINDRAAVAEHEREKSDMIDRLTQERDKLATELALYKPTAKTDIGGTL